MARFRRKPLLDKVSITPYVNLSIHHAQTMKYASKWIHPWKPNPKTKKKDKDTTSPMKKINVLLESIVCYSIPSRLHKKCLYYCIFIQNKSHFAWFCLPSHTDYLEKITSSIYWYSQLSTFPLRFYVSGAQISLKDLPIFQTMEFCVFCCKIRERSYRWILKYHKICITQKSIFFPFGTLSAREVSRSLPVSSSYLLDTIIIVIT